MTNYLDHLQDIKKKLIEEQKTTPSKSDSKEFENLVAKEKRLQAEFTEFIKGADIKR